tara:strand:- start:591 stop:944 length:354 start_codon:yes stop_codon:yes gene_type:complete
MFTPDPPVLVGIPKPVVDCKTLVPERIAPFFIAFAFFFGLSFGGVGCSGIGGAGGTGGGGGGGGGGRLLPPIIYYTFLHQGYLSQVQVFVNFWCLLFLLFFVCPHYFHPVLFLILLL